MILDAAQELIINKGPEHITMEDIAEKAELAKGTLYLYFKSKDEIQYEISRRGTEILNERTLKIIDRTKTGLENLVRMGWEFVSFSNDEREFFNLFIFFHNIDLLKIDLPYERIEDYLLHHSPFTILIELVEMGIKDGSLRSELSVIDTATALWSSLMGLLVIQENKREIYQVFRVKPETVLNTAFDIILNGIKNR